MDNDEAAQQEINRLKAVIQSQARRMDYVVSLLEREAKFLPEYKPENRRFHRAYATVQEVRDALVAGAGRW